MTSIHKFKVEGISGEEIDFAKFKGKKILVVNVTSQCGYIPQYQQLQELYEVFKDKLTVVGFPSNDFSKQGSGNYAEIKTFCTLKYGVNFPMTANVSILKPQSQPVYQGLCCKRESGKLDNTADWNFNKYLLDKNGQLLSFSPSSLDPFDEKNLNRAFN